MGCASVAEVGEARDDGAFNAAVFAPVDDPFGAASEAAVRVAVALEGEILAVGAGGALGKPLIITGDGRGDVGFVDLDAELRGELAGDVPGLHLHA